MSSSEVDRRIIAIVTPLATQLETVIQSIRELSERSSNRLTEGNLASERSKSSGQCSDTVTGTPRQQRSDWQNTTNPFYERPTRHQHNTRSSAARTPCRRLHGMDRDDASDVHSDDQMNQVMAAITDLPRRLHTTQAKKKLLQAEEPVFKGQQEKYKEFEHLLLNHIRPFQKKLTEDEKLQFFLSLFRYDAIEFWQTLHINPETTLKDVLTKNSENKMLDKTSKKLRGTIGINSSLTH